MERIPQVGLRIWTLWSHKKSTLLRHSEMIRCFSSRARFYCTDFPLQGASLFLMGLYMMSLQLKTTALF